MDVGIKNHMKLEDNCAEEVKTPIKFLIITKK